MRWVATSSSCILTLADAKSLLSVWAPRRPAISERSCSSSSIWLRSEATCLDASRMPMGTLAWEGKHSVSYSTHCEGNGSLLALPGSPLEPGAPQGTQHKVGRVCRVQQASPVRRRARARASMVPPCWGAEQALERHRGAARGLRK